MELPCQNCGKTVVVTPLGYYYGADNAYGVQHDGCDKPAVTMVAHNPQPFGVVTSGS